MPTRAPADLAKRLQAGGVQDELAKAAKRLFRETPEYKKRVRRRDGTAASWLEEEAESFAASAYEVMLSRVEEYGGRS